MDRNQSSRLDPSVGDFSGRRMKPCRFLWTLSLCLGLGLALLMAARPVIGVSTCDYCDVIGKACNTTANMCYRCTSSQECPSRKVCNTDIGQCLVGGVFSPFVWQEGVLIVLIFLAAGISNAGGVGGGLLFVPLLAILGSFPLPQASANSQSLILGASIANTVYNIRKRHVIRDAPRIDWNLVISTMPFFLCGTTPGYFLNISLPAYFTGFVLAAMLLALTVQSFLSGTRMTRRQWRSRRERLDHERQLAGSDASARHGKPPDAQMAGTTLSDTLQGPSTEESSHQQPQAVIPQEPETDHITHADEDLNEPSTFPSNVPLASDLEAAVPSSALSKEESGRMFRHRTVRGHPDQVRTCAISSSKSRNSNRKSLTMVPTSMNPALGNAQEALPESAGQHALGRAVQLRNDDQSTREARQNEPVTAADGATFVSGLRRSISFQDTDLATRRRLPRDESVASCLTLRPRARHSHSGVLRTASLYEDLAGLYTVHIDEPERRSRSKTTSTDRTGSVHVDELNLMDLQRSKRGRFWRYLDPVLFSHNLEEMLEAERPWFPWRHIVFLVFLILILFVCQFLSGAPYARSPVGVQLCGAVFWVIFTIQELALFSLGVLTVFRNLRLRQLRAEYGYPWFEHDGLTDMRWDGQNLYVYPAFIIVIGAIDSWTGLSSSALIIPYLYLIARTDLVTVQSSMAVVNLVASLAAAMVFLVDGRLNIGYSLFFGLWAMLGSYCGVFFVYYLVDRFQVRGFIILAISIAFLTATAIVLYEAIHNVLAAQAANAGWQMINICKATYL